MASIRLANALRGGAVVVVVTCCHRTTSLRLWLCVYWMSPAGRPQTATLQTVTIAAGVATIIVSAEVAWRATGWWLVGGG